MTIFGREGSKYFHELNIFTRSLSFASRNRYSIFFVYFVFFVDTVASGNGLSLRVARDRYRHHRNVIGEIGACRKSLYGLAQIVQYRFRGQMPMLGKDTA